MENPDMYAKLKKNVVKDNNDVCFSNPAPFINISKNINKKSNKPKG